MMRRSIPPFTRMLSVRSARRRGTTSVVLRLAITMQSVLLSLTSAEEAGKGEGWAEAWLKAQQEVELGQFPQGTFILQREVRGEKLDRQDGMTPVRSLVADKSVLLKFLSSTRFEVRTRLGIGRWQDLPSPEYLPESGLES